MAAHRWTFAAAVITWAAMLRKLLALLLLVTGIAAFSQPAQAGMLEVESARASADAGYACATQAGARAAQLAAPRDAVGDARPGPGGGSLAFELNVPTVRLQADRARE
jgi:hypothetical protein